MLSRLNRRGLTLVMALLLAFAAGPSLLAQTFRGTVSGTVTDTTGAIVRGATVLLTNPATDVTIKGVSNGAGEFDFPEVPVGTYNLTVSFAGFQTRKLEAIDVAVTKVENFPVVLTAGSEAQAVEVVANGVQVDTESSALVAVIDSKSVQEMPMNGRNFTQIGPLRAGRQHHHQLS